MTELNERATQIEEFWASLVHQFEHESIGRNFGFHQGIHEVTLSASWPPKQHRSIKLTCNPEEHWPLVVHYGDKSIPIEYTSELRANHRLVRFEEKLFNSEQLAKEFIQKLLQRLPK